MSGQSGPPSAAEHGRGLRHAVPSGLPHSDGAGVIDEVGDGVPTERACCYGAQSYRPLGTAPKYCVVPEALAVVLPGHALSSKERASVSRKVRPTERSTSEVGLGAGTGLCRSGWYLRRRAWLTSSRLRLPPTSSSAANWWAGGSISAFSSHRSHLEIPFWPLMFQNVRVHFLGSGDFPIAEKALAAVAINNALSAGWGDLACLATSGPAEG